MKQAITTFLLAACTLLASNNTQSCPTCVGRATVSSPPFFDDEAYEPRVIRSASEAPPNQEQIDNESANTE